jgi:ribosomal protein L13E
MSAPDKKKAKPKGKKAPPRKSQAPSPKVSKTKKAAPKAAPVEEKAKKAAPKPKKEVEREEAPAKASFKPEPLALGPLPEATIASRHIDSMHERPARGFSFGELASAGVPLNAARRQGLSLDIRRRSVVDGNVEALKGWFKSPNKPAAERAAQPVPVPAAGKKK